MCAVESAVPRSVSLPVLYWHVDVRRLVDDNARRSGRSFYQFRGCRSVAFDVTQPGVKLTCHCSVRAHVRAVSRMLLYTTQCIREKSTFINQIPQGETSAAERKHGRCLKSMSMSNVNLYSAFS